MENASSVFPYTKALPEIKRKVWYVFSEMLICGTLNSDQPGLLQTSTLNLLHRTALKKVVNLPCKLQAGKNGRKQLRKLSQPTWPCKEVPPDVVQRVLTVPLCSDSEDGWGQGARVPWHFWHCHLTCGDQGRDISTSWDWDLKLLSSA